MSLKTWTAVDDYIADKLIAADPVLEETLRHNGAKNLPAMDVSAPQGKMLNLLARMCGARSILEIGTLGGYSTIWLARALPADGRLVTLEFDPHHAQTARENIARAGFSAQVELRVGAAAETLPVLAEEGAGPFDFIFIDADKPSNPIYLDWALRLSRPGTIVVLDNVVRDGEVVNAANPDPRIQGTRAAFDLLAREPRFDATALQTVGAKGYDGFVLAIVRQVAKGG